MKGTRMIPLNLQFFAEGGGADPSNADPAAQGDGTDLKPADLNAMLAGNKALQSQFDQLVGKALTTARGKWEREQSMTAEQLMQARTSEQAQALAEREQALAARELRAEAMSLLTQRQLPTELIECVRTSDPATMNQSLQSAEKAFRQAVQQGIESRMAGSAPKGAGSSPTSHLTGFRAAAGIKTKP